MLHSFINSHKPNFNGNMEGYIIAIINVYGDPVIEDTMVSPVITASYNNNLIGWFDSENNQGFIK